MEPRERLLNVPLPHPRPLLRSTERPCSRAGRYNQDQPDSDKLISKINYLSWLIRVFEEYNSTESLRVVKKFVAANSRRIKAMLEELQQLRETLQKEDREAFKNYYLDQIQAFSSQSQHLDQQYTQEIQRKTAKESDKSVDRKSQEQLSNLKSTIEQLNIEIEQTNRQNTRMTQNISKCPFFAEYELTCKEIEGVKALNEKLRRTIHKRNESTKAKPLRQ